MLQLQPIIDEYETKGLVVITVTGDRDDAIKKFWETNNLNITVLADKNNAISRHYNVRSYPTGLFLDAEGNVLYSSIGWGVDSLDEWKKKAEEYL